MDLLLFTGNRCGRWAGNRKFIWSGPIFGVAFICKQLPPELGCSPGGGVFTNPTDTNRMGVLATISCTDALYYNSA